MKWRCVDGTWASSLCKKQMKLSVFADSLFASRGERTLRKAASGMAAKQSGQPVISAQFNLNSQQPASRCHRALCPVSVLLIYGLTLIAALARSTSLVRSLGFRCLLIANSVKWKENVPLCSAALTLSFWLVTSLNHHIRSRPTRRACAAHLICFTFV